MPQQQKDNTGVLFPNHNKETEKHPNLKGAALIGGVEYWMDAWVNLDRSQNKYISVKFKIKGQGKSKTQQKLDDEKKQNPDDDIPF